MGNGGNAGRKVVVVVVVVVVVLRGGRAAKPRVALCTGLPNSKGDRENCLVRRGRHHRRRMQAGKQAGWQKVCLCTMSVQAGACACECVRKCDGLVKPIAT